MQEKCRLGEREKRKRERPTRRSLSTCSAKFLAEVSEAEGWDEDGTEKRVTVRGRAVEERQGQQQQTQKWRTFFGCPKCRRLKIKGKLTGGKMGDTLHACMSCVEHMTFHRMSRVAQ